MKIATFVITILALVVGMAVANSVPDCNPGDYEDKWDCFDCCKDLEPGKELRGQCHEACKQTASHLAQRRTYTKGGPKSKKGKGGAKSKNSKGGPKAKSKGGKGGKGGTKGGTKGGY